MSRILFTGASEIVTSTAATPDIVMRNAALLVENGRVSRIGPLDALAGAADGAERVPCDGCVITPGFVDSHSHAVFGGWRAAEYAMRSRGVPYMEIARGGGGINASVRDVRARPEEELVELTRHRLELMSSAGTTTAEVKSGYGLETAAELKQLRVVRALQSVVPMTLVPTFLGAHEFPPEYRDRRDDYVDLIIHEMIPAVAAQELAVFCDVFMEPGVFDGTQTRRILEAAVAHGLVPKLHADELENSGAAELAAALGAASADHLGAISDAGIAALAHSGTVATLLPATLLFLGRTRYAPARRLLDAGATVALATDFNPGSAPTPNMQLVLTLACSQMRMDPLEAIVAATAGGARALRLTDGTGTLAPGAPADLVIWEIPDHRELPYRFGAAPMRALWRRGERILPRL
ncbi:MAG TPA: imidazolonepropionase [Longimicrobiales bacterium]